MLIRIDYVKLVLWSQMVNLPDKVAAAANLNARLDHFFDGDCAILPLPEEAPPEIPRLQMGTRDKHFLLSVARMGVDFVYKVPEENKKDYFYYPEVLETFTAIFGYFHTEFNVRFHRAAIVTEWLIELEKIPAAEYLQLEYMCTRTLKNTPYELEINILNRETISEFAANHWTKLKSGRSAMDPEKNNYIVLHNDINTISEAQYEITEPTLKNFLRESGSLINDDLENHFKRE